MRNKLNGLLLLLILLVPVIALGQDEELVVPNLYPPTGPTTGYLNVVIAADIAGGGAAAWAAGTRVYVLKRNGIYPWNASITVPANRHYADSE